MAEKKQLLDIIAVMDNPHNVPIWLEIRDMETLVCHHIWGYDEDWHALKMLSGRVVYDVDQWNRTWRAWDGNGPRPTKEEREAIPWLD